MLSCTNIPLAASIPCHQHLEQFVVIIIVKLLHNRTDMLQETGIQRHIARKHPRYPSRQCDASRLLSEARITNRL